MLSVLLVSDIIFLLHSQIWFFQVFMYSFHSHISSQKFPQNQRYDDTFLPYDGQSLPTTKQPTENQSRGMKSCVDSNEFGGFGGSIASSRVNQESIEEPLMGSGYSRSAKPSKKMYVLFFLCFAFFIYFSSFFQFSRQFQQQKNNVNNKGTPSAQISQVAAKFPSTRRPLMSKTLFLPARGTEAKCRSTQQKSNIT